MLTHLPNALTLLRIACIPVLVGLFFVAEDWAAWAACAVFVAAAITDYFDGYFARRLQQVSAFGKLLDPIADKMLVAAALLVLVGFGRLEGLGIIPALIILLRELLVSGMREYLAGLNAAGLPVTALAKWKTTVQMMALALLILGDVPPGGDMILLAGEIGLWIASILTAITGYQYVAEGLRLMGGEPEGKHASGKHASGAEASAEARPGSARG